MAMEEQERIRRAEARERRAQDKRDHDADRAAYRARRRAEREAREGNKLAYRAKRIAIREAKLKAVSGNFAEAKKRVCQAAFRKQTPYVPHVPSAEEHEELMRTLYKDDDPAPAAPNKPTPINYKAPVTAEEHEAIMRSVAYTGAVAGGESYKDRIRRQGAERARKFRALQKLRELGK